MPTRADWLTSDARQALLLKTQDAIAAQRARATHAAAQAQTVVAHEGWQAFLNRLETEIAARQVQYDTLARVILTGPDLGDALGSQKVLLNQIDGQIKGLGLARDIIPGLIEAGAPPQ